MTTYTRGDYSGKRGVTVVTDSLTFVGTGGVDLDSANIKNGTTTVLNSTTLNNIELGANVDGQLVALPFAKVLDATGTVTMMGFSASTSTYAVAPRAGSVVGLSVSAHTAHGASRHATFTVYVGTTSTGFAATIPASAQTTVVSQVKDTDAFAAGKKLNIKVAHASLTTYTYGAVLLVEI